MCPISQPTRFLVNLLHFQCSRTIHVPWPNFHSLVLLQRVVPRLLESLTLDRLASYCQDIAQRRNRLLKGIYLARTGRCGCGTSHSCKIAETNGVLDKAFHCAFFWWCNSTGSCLVFSKCAHAPLHSSVMHKFVFSRRERLHPNCNAPTHVGVEHWEPMKRQGRHRHIAHMWAPEMTGDR